MRPPLFITILLCLASPIVAAEPEFPLTQDSKAQPGVAKGTLIKETYKAASSSLFPGTEREYQLYLPAGFDASRPTPFMVFQDGVIYQAPVVFDNLIAKKEIPPLVGVFIRPGVVPAANENALPRYNRSLEYDSVTDTYARFLTEEFLPALEKRHGLKFSADPNDAAISGNSSGGICAFMAAWHRPERFRRVFTGVGTYVGIHGADQLAVLVRKVEPKPIRVFLQSGTGDNNLYCGDWWMANQMMERSLTWAGYEVDHAWGEGGHNQKHASQVFPDVMRWLWKDWETRREVRANAAGASRWKGYEIFEPGTVWTRVADTQPGDMLAVNEDGKVSTTQELNSRARRHDGLELGKIKGLAAQIGSTPLVAWSPDQTLLYITTAVGRRIASVQVDAKGQAQHAQEFVMLDALGDQTVSAHGMCVDADGRLYVATEMGVQVCDQAGRVNFIIPTPTAAVDVCFGGAEGRMLHVACASGVYQRPVKVQGIPHAGKAPVKPAAPKL